MFTSRFTAVAGALALLIGNSSVLAGDCVMSITRTACPGKEAESFSKCDGKASCEQKVPAPSAAICATKTKISCANSRRTITKYKSITATFDGEPVEGGKDFCVGHPDYPYVDKPDCK
ncbi:hypothetical protein [Pseudomarimonas arenosa]|uniref:Uncharacterized protein n=1 Tax=Pseudomarimonas arenosa TaxID=2774145 RepID=A0AAW3ZMI0_9GAMM|nr:hypothetical protein [Pseudomarimonas arenosa]MBD8526943.1 hypothetical protein [Pseudomarimonas arenosa]